MKTNKERFEDAYNEALNETTGFLQEAYTDYKFFVGDQWTSEEKSYLAKFGREPVVFNYLRRFIKRVGGHQRKNRMATSIEPTETQDEYIAEIYDDVQKWVILKDSVYQTISDAFEKGSLVTGWNLLHPYMDYSTDPINGMIKTKRRAYNTFLLSPDFTRLDLSDCRYLITSDFMSRDMAKGLLPNKASAIDDLPGGLIDNKFEFIGTDHLESDDVVNYTEFWEKVTIKRYMTIDNVSGETIKWNGSKADLNRHIEKFPWVSYIAFFEPTVQMTVFIQGEEMYHGIDPYGSKERGISFGEYPHVLVPGYFEPDFPDFRYKIQGIGRTMRDAQREENKRRCQMFSILDSSPYGGYIVKNGSVINHDDLYQTGPGVVITLDKAAQMSDVQELRQREIPQSTMQLSQQLKNDLIELGGGSEEFVGTADTGNTQISGTLAKMRASNSVESLQDLIDNLNFAQENLGRKHVKFININFTSEFIEKITNKEIPEGFFDEDVSKFNLVAAEGMLTDTNKNLAYVQSLQALQSGVNIPHKFVVSNLPIANKSELMRMYDEEAEQAQQQQAKLAEMEDMQKRLANAEIIHKLSLGEQQRKRSVADEALAMERVSESKLNQSKVINNRIDAVLKQIQVTKEIQGMDLDRMQSAVRFVLEMYENKRIEETEETQSSKAMISQDSQNSLLELALTDNMKDNGTQERISQPDTGVV